MSGGTIRCRFIIIASLASKGTIRCQFIIIASLEGQFGVGSSLLLPLHQVGKLDSWGDFQDRQAMTLFTTRSTAGTTAPMSSAQRANGICSLAISPAPRHGILSLFDYCLMSNHFHLLLKPAPGQSISRILQSLTVAHPWRHHRRQGTSGHVWQGRFRSPVIQDGDHLLVVLRYIEANPVRAAMVADRVRQEAGQVRYC